LHCAAERFEAPIETRLHSGKGRGQHASNFFEAEILLKTENENFAIDRGNAIERGVHAGFFFGGQDQMQWRRLILCGELHRGTLFGVGQRVEALHFFGALPVDHQVARDAEKPSFKFVFAVVLMAAFEDANPRFLEKIFGALAAGGQIEQIAEQPVLVLLDQLIEEIGVAALEPLGEGLVVVGHLGGEEKNRP
jgi:hypothetical protein